MNLIKKHKFLLAAIILLTGVTWISLCSYSDHAEASVHAENENQAVKVQTEVVEKQSVSLWKDFSGRLTAVNRAAIQPQVSGTITEVKVIDGQQVEEGELLFLIDPRPFEAAVKNARAALLQAQTQKKLADRELKRAQNLVNTNAVSKSLFDRRETEAAVAKAAVESAQASLDHALIDLDYAHIKSPVAGRISQIEVTRGNIVEAGPNAPVLTTVISDQGIYADFDVDETTYLQTVRSVARDRKSENSIPVKINTGANSQIYEGFIHSFDNEIDVTSGTIRARALFDNVDKSLLPGMFVNVQLGDITSGEEMLISDRAIGTNQDRKFVYVVDNENKATYREVKVGSSIDGKRVVLSGLSEGERIINDGIIKIQPGMIVSPM